MNDSILEAFRLAKMENGLSDAIVMLEREILKDYDVRRFYGQTLRYGNPKTLLQDWFQRHSQ